MMRVYWSQTFDLMILGLKGSGKAEGEALESHKVSPLCATDRAIVLMYPI